ncbi:L-methionine/branched-chain amino acid transporter [Endozoicomonas sp. SCSIO W0465]|uniref:L-methionine/branched-chain amino acid transporter n=1 Tax=Endozoicomonas sp. SCSIO W0465 TaxID=2918516 RepID=UPI002075DC43|nr:L-methionine/branched-chain amino acid transporter [Endozoicomonas sp. SCSIO W0465]USE33959.1 L-methionine/branched-chain amino acid transporter [Endozoicomonas sp. SCSIO W0465]
MQVQISGIGRWQGAGLLATTLLGTSVFILPQFTIQLAGYGALWAWVLLTLTIIPVALVFASLASRFPHAAGPAYFVEKAFGSVAGRTIGIIYLCAVPLGAPAAIIMTYQFIDALFMVPDSIAIAVQLAFLLLLYGLNFRGIHISATLQLILTLSIISVLGLMMMVWGVVDVPAMPQKATPGNGMILQAAGLAFWSFLGMEAMSHLAGDFRNPEKDLKPAIMIGVAIVGCIYLACTWLILSIPVTTPLAMAGVFDKLMGGLGAQVIGILGLAGGVATVNVYTASLIRLMLSFSQEGVLPAWFCQQNRHGVSERALVSVLLIMAVIVIMTHFTDQNLEDLVSWVNGVFVIIYFASMLAAFRLLPAKYHWVTVPGCLFCLMLAWGLGWKMLYAMGLLAVTTPLLWLHQVRTHHKKDEVFTPYN